MLVLRQAQIKSTWIFHEEEGMAWKLSSQMNSQGKSLCLQVPTFLLSEKSISYFRMWPAGPAVATGCRTFNHLCEQLIGLWNMAPAGLWTAFPLPQMVNNHWAAPQFLIWSSNQAMKKPIFHKVAYFWFLAVNFLPSHCAVGHIWKGQFGTV